MQSRYYENSRDFLSGWADGTWVTAAQRRLALALIVSVILFFAVLPLLPMLKGWYWPLTHETYRYAILLDHFTAGFREGVLFPRWLPEIMGGYGYPQFVFYQPAFFFLALPFDLLFDHPMVSSGMALLVMLGFGGAGAYHMCRQLGGPAVALLGACLFLITPYVYSNLAVRGDWSELLACMITPWAISFLIGLHKDVLAGEMPLCSGLGLGLSLAAIVVSHPLVALLSAIMMCVLSFGMVVAFIGERRFTQLRIFVLNAGLAGLFGLLISAPYWWPVFALKGLVNIDAAKQGYFLAESHVVYFSQLFSRSWGFGVSVPGIDDQMSFQLGLPHFLFAAVGAAWAVKTRGSFFLVVAFILYVLVLAAMLPFSSGLWSLPLFEIMQFPWRLLSITVVLQILCLTGLTPLLKGLGRLSLPVAVILLAISGWWYSNQFAAIPLFRNFSASNIQWLQNQDAASLMSYSGANEFLPRTALGITKLSPLGKDSRISAHNGVTISADESTPYKIKFQTDNVSDEGHVRIGQIYFPGWIVRVDGEQLAPEVLVSNLTEHGLIQVPIPRGRHPVEAWYDGPPGWRWRAMLSLLSLLLIPVIIVLLHRFERSRSP